MKPDNREHDLDPLFAEQRLEHAEISDTPNFHGDVIAKTTYAHGKPVLFEVTRSNRFKPKP